MIDPKKWTVLLSLTGFVGFGAWMSKPAQQRNLKVLPADISDAKLDSLMKTYTVALGVNCKFCHAENIGFPGGLNYASDAQPMKESARKMIEMTFNLNKTWFYFDSTRKVVDLNVVTCNTCHRGEAFPEQ